MGGGAPQENWQKVEPEVLEKGLRLQIQDLKYPILLTRQSSHHWDSVLWGVAETRTSGFYVVKGAGGLRTPGERKICSFRDLSSSVDISFWWATVLSHCWAHHPGLTWALAQGGTEGRRQGQVGGGAPTAKVGGFPPVHPQ